MCTVGSWTELNGSRQIFISTNYFQLQHSILKVDMWIVEWHPQIRSNWWLQQIVSNFNMAFWNATKSGHGWKDISRQDPFSNFKKLQVMQIRGNACSRYGGRWRQIFEIGDFNFNRHSFLASLTFMQSPRMNLENGRKFARHPTTRERAYLQVGWPGCLILILVLAGSGWVSIFAIVEVRVKFSIEAQWHQLGRIEVAPLLRHSGTVPAVT